jgi:hypothetical protein
MKHLITERERSLIVFTSAQTMKEICELADFIETSCPGHVLEVTHNLQSKQGNIILKKDDTLKFRDKIDQLVVSWQTSQK